MNIAKTIPRMFDYAVVGAGGAGIATVGVLLDKGKRVLWVDPSFTVGRLNRYRNVPSNTKVKHFVEYLESCKSFQGYNRVGPLFGKPPEDTCLLGVMVDELQRLTGELQTRACSVYGTVDKIERGLDEKSVQTSWKVQVSTDEYDITHRVFEARHLVYALGSTPQIADYEFGDFQTIPLDTALDQSRLAQCGLQEWLEEHPEDKIVVWGDSHSAMLVLRNLWETPGIAHGRILNLYKRPTFRYASYRDDGTIKYDNTGLKGDVAVWVANMYVPSNPRRMHVEEWEKLEKDHGENDIHIAAIGFLPACDPKDEANGWERRLDNPIPWPLEVGIYNPEMIETPEGETEANVGLIKFMRHIKKILAEE